MDKIAIIKKLKKYNFDDLYLWLSVTSIHPNNQNYGLRFDLLLALLLSLSPSDFEGQKFGQKECCELIAFYSEQSSQYFSHLEDFQPLNQLDVIPFFWNRDKYLFFYGMFERPYEYLKMFYELYCGSDTPQKELSCINSYLKCSLDFQTSLLRKILAKEGSKEKSDEIIVPSNSYYNDLVRCFMIDNKRKECLQGMLPLKTPSSDKSKDLLTSIMDCTFFDSLIVKSKKHEYMLWPNGHIEALFRLSKDVLSKLPAQEILLKSKQRKLYRICTQFFTIKGIIAGVFSKNTSNLVDDFDVVAVVDGSKLILFKVIGADDADEFPEEIYKVRRKVEEISNVISRDDITGISYATSPSKIYGIPTKEVELFTIYVFQQETLADYIIKINEKELTERDHIIELINLEQIFTLLPEKLSFVKFLRNDSELFRKVRCLCIDYLDRFIYYIENKESYLSQGVLPNFICFEPHSWSDYYNRYLSEKYKDNVYELLNKHFPNNFNRIKHLDDHRYSCIDTAYLDCGHAVKLNGDRLVFISLPPEGYFCESMEIRTAEFIVDLYSYYISRLEENLKIFFESIEIILPDFSFITIFPKSYIERERIDFILKDQILFNDKPLSVRTGRVQNVTGLRTVVVYDPDKLESLFSSPDSSGERLFVSEYLKSIISYYCGTMSYSEIEVLVQEFVEQNIPQHRKAFSFEYHFVSNPKLDSYRDYDRVQEANISQINQEVAAFLAKSQIKPNKYEGHDALRILSSIYDFLEGQVEKELAQYNMDVIFHAYRQLEYVLGQECKLLQQSGFHLTKYVEYDVVNRAVEKRYENHKSIVSIKFTISSILKIGTTGKKIVNQETWDRIHALSSIIQTTSIMYECMKFSVIPHYISINNQYEFEIKSMGQIVNFEEFRYTETEKKVQYQKEQYLRKGNLKVTKSDSQDTKSFYEKLEKYFLKNQGFKFNDMLTVLIALSRCDIEWGAFQPLNVLKEEEILAFLRKEIIDCPPDEELSKIITFLSVDFHTYKNERFLLFHLFKSKNRFNLKPIIKLNTNEYCFGNEMCYSSALIWWNCLSTGNYVHKCDDELNQILDDYRRTLDKQLEKKAEKKCIEILGKENVEAHIINFKRLSKNFPSRPSCGEIDLLTINRDTKTIYVMDVKNRIRSFRPYDIAMEVEIFLTGKKSYFGKLVEKEKFIRHNIKEVLGHFHIRDYNGWRTQAAFIVSQVYPTAYYKKKAADFVLIENLKEYL